MRRDRFDRLAVAAPLSFAFAGFAALPFAASTGRPLGDSLTAVCSEATALAETSVGVCADSYEAATGVPLPIGAFSCPTTA